MVVAMSQRIAADWTQLLKGRLGDETVTCVISASATDDPAISKWRRARSRGISHVGVTQRISLHLYRRDAAEAAFRTVMDA